MGSSNGLGRGGARGAIALATASGGDFVGHGEDRWLDTVGDADLK
jgi:hypothetical protein